MEDVVAAVGPGGHFLRARETRQFLRRGELHAPRLLAREPYEAWSAARTAETRRAAEEQRAVAAVEEILATHRPLPLPAGAGQRIAAVVAAAGRELGGR